MNPQDYMKIALAEAQKAAAKDEVPVGAVVVNPADGTVVAKAHNLSEHTCDACAHAEIAAMQKACKKLGQRRLWGMDIYVTLEPCTMCAAAVSLMRIAHLYFGAEDAKGGAVQNGVRFFEAGTCHHRPAVSGGILAGESAALLKGFFAAKRKPKAVPADNISAN